MELSVKERLLLLDLLPVQGDITTLLVVREAQNALGFDADEVDKLKFQTNEGRVVWDEAADTGKDVPISDAAMSVVIRQLHLLNERQQLNLDLLPIYERFVENK